MKGVAVRELGLADQAMATELLDAIQPEWRDALAPGASGPRAYLADPRAFVFGGYVDNEPAGWLWGTHMRRPDGQQMTYIHQVDVLEPHRRLGLASMLVEAAVALARRNGSHRAWLIADTGDGPANELYRSLGGRPPNPDDGSQLYRWDL